MTKVAGGSDAAHGGVIVQKDSHPITIDNYSGHMTLIYAHDTAKPSDVNMGLSMIGGDTTIMNAAEGSAITMLTDNIGLNPLSGTASEKNLVSGTLNALANKLFYKGYADKHLTGTVKIAEGLTASSAALKTGDISWKSTGQGEYKYCLLYTSDAADD